MDAHINQLAAITVAPPYTQQQPPEVQQSNPSHPTLAAELSIKKH